MNIAADSKPDIRYIAWMKAGPVKLKPGTATISFKMHSGNNHHGALDCFCLTTKSFTPAGSRKPGEKLGLADPGTWAFEVDDDEFSPQALFDLRSLNEKLAGEAGYVQRTPAGDFALGNGQPVRFWAVNTSGGPSSEPADIRKHARFLAKRGVNMVRWHGALNPKGPESSNDPMEPVIPKRVQRGGSYLCSDMYCTGYLPGARGKGAVDSGASHLGFRCVKSP